MTNKFLTAIIITAAIACLIVFNKSNTSQITTTDLLNSDNTQANLFNNKDIIKIGIAGPFTGKNASFGKQLLTGAEQAISDLNVQGGIQGKKVELIPFNDACDPKQAIMVANRSVDDIGVDAMIGHICSSSTIAASEVYADANIIMITPTSTSPKVTDRNLDTILRLCGRDEQQSNVAATFITDKLQAKRIAIIYDNNDTYGQSIANATRMKLHNLGIKEVLYQSLNSNNNGNYYLDLATKLKALNLDAIYFGGFHTEAGLLVQQLRDNGINVPFVSGDGIMTKDFITTAGGQKYLNNIYMTFSTDPRDLDTAQGIVAKFRENNIEPEPYSLYTYAAIQIIANAIASTSSTDGKLLTNYLKLSTIDTILGNKSWDSKGDLTTADYIMYQWQTDGTYKQYAKNTTLELN